MLRSTIDKKHFSGSGYPCSYAKINGRWETVLEHRRVWEEAFGPIPPGYHVHHEDGNKLNNSLDNLRCLTIADHNRMHHEENQPTICPYCGNEAYHLIKGACYPCADRFRRTGSYGYAKNPGIRKQKKRCRYGCNRPISAMGLCITCYSRENHRKLRALRRSIEDAAASGEESDTHG